MKLFLLSLLFFNSSYSMESQGRLKLEVQNIRNNKGLIQVLLFSHKQGFPDTPSEALKKITIPINNHRAEYTWMKIDYKAKTN